MFLAIRDLRRNIRRFLLLGVVIALVALLSTVLSGLATGLVSDGISGLRALPLDRITLKRGPKPRSPAQRCARTRWRPSRRPAASTRHPWVSPS